MAHNVLQVRFRSSRMAPFVLFRGCWCVRSRFYLKKYYFCVPRVILQCHRLSNFLFMIFFTWSNSRWERMCVLSFVHTHDPACIIIAPDMKSIIAGLLPSLFSSSSSNLHLKTQSVFSLAVGRWASASMVPCFSRLSFRRASIIGDVCSVQDSRSWTFTCGARGWRLRIFTSQLTCHHLSTDWSDW